MSIHMGSTQHLRSLPAGRVLRPLCLVVLIAACLIVAYSGRAVSLPGTGVAPCSAEDRSCQRDDHRPFACRRIGVKSPQADTAALAGAPTPTCWVQFSVPRLEVNQPVVISVSCQDVVDAKSVPFLEVELSSNGAKAVLASEGCTSTAPHSAACTYRPSYPGSVSAYVRLAQHFEYCKGTALRVWSGRTARFVWLTGVGVSINKTPASDTVQACAQTNPVVPCLQRAAGEDVQFEVAATTGTPLCLLLHTTDAHGHWNNHGGDVWWGRLVSKDAVVSVDVVDNNNGTYTLTAPLPLPGRYRMTLLWAFSNNDALLEAPNAFPRLIEVEPPYMPVNIFADGPALPQAEQACTRGDEPGFWKCCATAGLCSAEELLYSGHDTHPVVPASPCVWTPFDCRLDLTHTPESVQTCLHRQRISRVVFVGDSHMRTLWKFFVQLMGGNVTSMQEHGNLHADVPVGTGHVQTSFVWLNFFEAAALSVLPRLPADFVVVNLGHWYGQSRTHADFQADITRLAAWLHAHGFDPWRVVWRTNTAYPFRRGDWVTHTADKRTNPKLALLNALGTRAFQAQNFTHALDSFAWSLPRIDEPPDKAHFMRVDQGRLLSAVSHADLAVLLTMLCGRQARAGQ